MKLLFTILNVLFFYISSRAHKYTLSIPYVLYISGIFMCPTMLHAYSLKTQAEKDVTTFSVFVITNV